MVSGPSLIVPKKTDDPLKLQYRFCIKFRALNKFTVKDTNEIWESFNGSENYSTLDSDQRFPQIPVAEEDRLYTSFIDDNKLYKFKVIPFWLCHAPATFCPWFVAETMSCVSGRHNHVCQRFWHAFECPEAVFSELVKAKLKTVKIQIFHFLGFKITKKGLQSDKI